MDADPDLRKPLADQLSSSDNVMSKLEALGIRRQGALLHDLPYLDLVYLGA